MTRVKSHMDILAHHDHLGRPTYGSWVHVGEVVKGATTPWSWASLPETRRPDIGPTWSGWEAEVLGGRRIEGFSLLTDDEQSCWLNSERRWRRPEPRKP